MTTYADAAVEVIADFDKFDDTFARRLRSAVTKGSANVQKSMGGIEGSIKSVIGGLGKLGLSFVAIVGKAALAATAVAAFGAVSAAASLHLIAFAAALAPVGGLAAALPAALGVAVAAMAVFKLAAVGMKDVMSSLASGDLDKFNAALKDKSTFWKSAPIDQLELRLFEEHPSLETLRRNLRCLAEGPFQTGSHKRQKKRIVRCRHGCGDNIHLERLRVFDRLGRRDPAQPVHEPNRSRGGHGA